MPAILITPPAAEPLSLADAKNFLRVEHDADDELIAALIAAARGEVELATRRVLMTQTWRIVLHRLPNMQSYFDSPKTLGELRDAAREPKKGYDIHSYRRAGVRTGLRLSELNDQRAGEPRTDSPIQTLGDQCVVRDEARSLRVSYTARSCSR